MKELLFVLFGIFFCLTYALAGDYRQILFGNNYKNIIRVNENSKVNMYVNQVEPIIENSIDTWEYEFYAYEETPVVRETEYEKYSEAYFNSYEKVFSLNERSSKFKSINFEDDYEFMISAPFALIDSERPFRYTIQNMFDNNPATCFVEKIEDKEHVSYELILRNRNLVLQKIKVINGLSYDNKSYSENNRVKSIKDCEDYSDSITFKDKTLTPQIFDWKHSTFVISDKYKGTKYDDTCISELDFYINEKNSNQEYWLLETNRFRAQP